MTAALDLNNEMILMRKEINRARVRAISKLVRHIRNLRNKKGNEAQKVKNSRRVERLVEEMDILKDLKPDTVFKAHLNSKLNSQDLMNSEISLEQRAIIRVGSANFLQKRFQAIKEKVAEFHTMRSSKPISNTFGESLPNSDVQSGLENDPGKSMKNEECSDTDTSETNNARAEENSVAVDVVLKAGKTVANTSRTAISTTRFQDKKPKIRMRKKSEEEEQETPEEEIQMSDEEPSDNDNIVEKEENVSSSPDVTNPCTKNEDFVVGTSEDGYQIVIPSYMQGTPLEDSEKINFNRLAEARGADDVTDLLPNIGADFDSSDEGSTDIELEDVVETALQKKQKREEKFAHSVAVDMFFVDSGGDPENKFRRSKNKLIESDKVVEDEALSQVKSCFLESLASVSHQRTKGKNRMSQRARKKFALKPPQDRNKGNVKTSGIKGDKEKTEPSTKNAPTKSVEQQSLHPSWEASRKRKQALATLQEFQGKRICFDDSD